MKRKFIMAVGLPLSGKSTLAEKYKKEGWEIIERDALLEKILTDPRFEELVNNEKINIPPDLFQKKGFEWNFRSSLAGNILGQTVAEIANKSTHNIFYDGTNLKFETRLQVLTDLDKSLEIEAIVFRVPLETVLERAKEISKTGERKGLHADSLHEADIQRMAGWFQEPALQEGFTSIHEYQIPVETKNEMKIKLK